MENKFIVAKEGKLGRMRLFNEIDSEGYTLDRFLQEFDSLQNDDSVDEIEITINSLGGSTWRGFPIVSAISNSAKPVTTVIDAVGASMAALIFLAGTRRKMYDYSQLMLHSASYSDGSPQDDALRQTNENIFNLIKAVTKRAKDKIRNWLSKDSWFTSKQALAEGFATEIIKTRLSLVDSYQGEVRDMVASAKPMDAINKLKDKYSNMEFILNELELNAEATGKDVTAKVQQIKNALAIKEQELVNSKAESADLIAKLKVFTDKEADAKEKSINDLIDSAFANRQINAEGKNIWKTILSADYENGTKAIKALAKTEKLSEIINTDSNKIETIEFKLDPIQELMFNKQ